MESVSIQDLVITIVEPSTMQQHNFDKHLKSLNVSNIYYCDHGKAALTHLEVDKPDLIISCMYLPDMSGIELINKIRSNSIIEDVPFMLVTSETAFEMLDPIRQAGVVAIIEKPFNASDITTALFTTLDFINPNHDIIDNIKIDDLDTLVVDDSQFAQKHITRVLNNLGIDRISYAENGKVAIEKINNHFFDLIVTDYNMPVMDGAMLTKQIRENSNQRSIPILMVTSEGDQSRLAAVQNSGVSGICDKPFEAEHVKLLIKQMLAEY